MAVSKDLKLDGDDLFKGGTEHIDRVLPRPAEDELSAWQCIRKNPKICLWIAWANIGSIMVGYENLALSVCLAMPAFQKTFASEINGVLLIPAHWQSLWNAMFNVMTIVGSIAAGPIQDFFGRRAIFLTVALVASAGVAVAFVSEHPATYLGAKILTGFALGASVVGTQTYVSEISPLAMRGIALSINSVALNLGLLIAISATFSRIAIMDPSAFRVVFAGAWAFPIGLALGLPFLSESPYWLVMKGKRDQARNSLIRLHPAGEDINTHLLNIEHTVELELRQKSEAGSLIECFKGTDLRRTMITLICFYISFTVGSVLSANSPYFLNQSGLSSATVLMITQVGTAMGVLSSIVNLFLMAKLNHRILIFSGVGICILAYLTMGIAGAMRRTTKTMLVVGIALQFSTLSYGPAVGAAMAVAGEVSATRLRAKSLALGNGFQGVAGTFWQAVLPYLFNQDKADLGGNLGWIFFGIAVLHIALLYFFVPGTKGRTYEELDLMFEKKLSARVFEKYVLEEGQA
ncbi:MFS general substrate transporter [Curvularia clavata]|uniref:MFS general substrate transporter n=1 Tax=Curvularia clavata TaxID=95742 RepID=A0A9Q9DSS7_CURCL|nr:MFS general substrate transporter [Curvularia clavata]